MQTIRKSNDGNVMITRRAGGFAVSQRNSRWETAVWFRGTTVVEWNTVATGLSQIEANALFDRLTAKAA